MKKMSSVGLFLLLNSVYFFSYFQRVGIPGTIFNELQSTFSISATTIVGLGSLTFFVYGLMQIFSGVLSDRFGGFKTFLIGAFLLSVSSILFSFSHSVSMLFTTRAIVGFSAGFIYISLIKILTTIYPEKKFPFYLGITLVLGYSGGIFATYPLERLVSYLGWRNSLLLIGIICSICTIICFSVFRISGTPSTKKQTFSLPLLMGVLKNTRSLPLFISSPINFGIYFLFQSTIGKKFLQDFCAFSSSDASLFTFIMMITNTVFTFVSSYTSGLTGKRRSIITSATFITLTALLILFFNLSFLNKKGLFLVSYILLAIGAAAGPVYTTTMKESNAISIAATSVGLLNTISYLFIGFLGWCTGFILDHFRDASVEKEGIIIYPPSAYRAIFLFCIILAVCSFLVSLLIKDKHTKIMQ